MRYGVPVVAFDAGGIKEWLTDGVNGLLVPWMDQVRYAQAIKKLLRDKTLARTMGERGRQTVTDCFGFAKYLDGLEALFVQLSRPAHSVLD
jgi:glycosyltransferase involved in cell wall biosynthesis